MSLAVAFTPVFVVVGQSLGVRILQVLPLGTTVITGQSQYNGTAGQVFSLQGSIYTSNGTYHVTLGQNLVATGTAIGYYVNATFTVPSILSGSYPLALTDVALNVTSTSATPINFQVLRSYYIHANPSQTQEGSSVVLTVGVTGGTPNSPYSADVTVEIPGPLNTTYSQIVSIGTSDQAGTASGQVTYPNSSFGNTTDYVGTYNIYFNQSASIAQSQFYVGFLDSRNYHRGDTVTISAIGYQPSQAATLSITNSNGTLLNSALQLTASADGTIKTTWPVPPNIPIGNYTATITPTGTQKAISDVETFLVPGYPVQITTVNLAGHFVPNIVVQVLDLSTGVVYSSTSSTAFGLITLYLEKSPCSLTAFWNGVNVGQTNITITGDPITLQCKLTDLKITVQNENKIALQAVNLTITYQYQPTNGGASKTGDVSGVFTDSSGSCMLNSTLPGINYNIDASLYNRVFNSGNNTFSNLPAQAEDDIVITCPNETLTINVAGNNEAPISGANIKLVELTNGLFYTATTDTSGSATSQVTFGVYKLQIYKDDILINQTNINAFSNNQEQVLCMLYGIQVSVSVVDFFGTPISNANVTLNGPGKEQLSVVTKSNGTANFNNVIGGNLQVIAVPHGTQNIYQAVTVTVDKSTSVQIKLAGYIAVGGFLMPLSSLLTIIIILIAIVLFAMVEIYRRRKNKQPREN